MAGKTQYIQHAGLSIDKILYDFADIESWDPDGNYYEFCQDNSNYYPSGTSNVVLGNWALEWQTAHTEGVDWYNTAVAHTAPLNGNLKAYAAWALWAEIGAIPEPGALWVLVVGGISLAHRRW